MIAQKTFLEALGFAPVSPIVSPVAASPVDDDFDEEYEAWKHEMGLDVEMSEQQVIDCYTYELAVL